MEEKTENIKRIHYAWVVCIGCAIMLFCTSGLAINAFSIYMPHILRIDGFTNSQLSMMTTFRNLVGFICLTVADRYFKRFTLRKGMALAGMVTAVAYFMFGSSDSIYIYYLGAALLGVGYSLGAMIPLTMMICNWFEESRNTALGLCTSATGLSTLGIPVIINNTVSKYGLHTAFYGEAIAILVLVTISFLLIRDCPADKRMIPYGLKHEDDTAIVHEVGLESKDWYMLIPMLIMLGAALNVSYSNVSLMITGEGYSVETEASVIAVSGLAIVAGKLFTGKLGDRIGNYKCNFICALLLSVGLFLCCIMKKGTGILFTGIATYSAGNGAASLCISKWSADLSTTAKRDKNIRRFQMIYVAGGLLFAPVPGMLADANNGSYVKAFELFTIFSVLIFIMIQIVYIEVEKRRKKYEERQYQK